MQSEYDIRIARARCRKARRIWRRVRRMEAKRWEYERSHGRVDHPEYHDNFWHCSDAAYDRAWEIETMASRICPIDNRGYGPAFPCDGHPEDRGCNFRQLTGWILENQ